MKSEKEVAIYTDGGSIGNPGPGGYGAVIIENGRRRELSGGFRRTTNNRMELMAAIVGLRALDRPAEVNLFSDSRYLVDAMTKGWAKSWRANRWRRGRRGKALNPDLWSELLRLSEVHSVSFRWVRGHAGNPLNERAHQLAMAAASRDELPADETYESQTTDDPSQPSFF